VSAVIDSLPEISGVDPLSAAARAGLQPGDRIVEVNGIRPRDILEWHRLVDNDVVDMHVSRGRESLDIVVERVPGEPFGARVSSAVFDRIHTCDNHCEFCFIYQLPKGMRQSLYLKDDDYRLSFLFGNFTTLTRFTEADLERVLDERLSPLYVSIHAVDPHVRSEMLRNNRGGFSLRWLKLLLENGIDARAQIVLCPGVNDGDVLDSTFCGLLEQFSELESIAVVPLGLSRFNTEGRMRVQTPLEAQRTISIVEAWQSRFQSVLGRQPIHLSDEFYMVAGIDVPAASHYGNYPMLEDGVGLVRSFVESFELRGPDVIGRADGFFSAVDAPNPSAYVKPANPAADSSLRPATPVGVSISKRAHRSAKPPAIVTGSYGATMFRSFLAEAGFAHVPVVEVANEHFGGNTAVAGLMTYSDIVRTLRQFGGENVYLLPDVCLNEGVFLDGATVDDLSKEFDIEVIATSGVALRHRLTAAQKEEPHV
jgi:putative radical SAM enzyme (TIGR03279 family)